MKTKLLTTAVILTCCAAIGWFSSTIQGSTTYEVKPQISIPSGYKTDATHTVDSYERLMNRILDMNEKNFSAINNEMQQLNKKMDMLAMEILAINKRISDIEKLLQAKQTKDSEDVKKVEETEKVEKAETEESKSVVDSNSSPLDEYSDVNQVGY